MTTEPTQDELNEMLNRVEKERTNLYRIYNDHNLIDKAYQRVMDILNDIATSGILNYDQTERIKDLVNQADYARERRHLGSEYSSKTYDNLITVLGAAYTAVELQLLPLEGDDLVPETEVGDTPAGGEQA